MSNNIPILSNIFEYRTYNGVPFITYGLIGLTSAMLALLTFNPDILNINRTDKTNTIGEMMGLDKLEIPSIPAFDVTSKSGTEKESTSYIPGINMLPQPFSTTDNDDEKYRSDLDETRDTTDISDDTNPDTSYDTDTPDESVVYNPLQKDENDKNTGGKKTRKQRRTNNKGTKSKRQHK